MTDTRVTISAERYEELRQLEKERQSGAGFRCFPVAESLQMEADAKLGALVRQMPSRMTVGHVAGCWQADTPEGTFCTTGNTPEGAIAHALEKKTE